MARNVEIKARVDNPAVLLERARAISGTGPIEIIQDDTFFSCLHGRLKLRELSPSQGQLIFYQRPDSRCPKVSHYVISETSEPRSLRNLLAQSLGIIGRIRKRRLLFLAGSARIHFDEVEGLGHFMEIEIVLADGDSVEAGEATLRDLMARLGISEESLLAGAYMDMHLASRARAGEKSDSR
jgi:predicted adenylyl cyclase CyaB